jgi:Ca-activated chloride channel family protein
MPLQFEHIEYGWLLIPVLVLTWLLWYAWEKRKAAIRKSIANPSRLLSTLLVGYNPADAKKKLVFFSIATLGLVLAIMNPRVVSENANVPMQGIQVMIAMDVSNSMLATDIAPNRLERARNFGIKLANSLGGNKVGLLAFAGEARLQMPPTTDISAIVQGLQTLSPESVPLQGTNVEAALDEAKRTMAGNETSYKAMVLVTDGEELEGAAIEKAKAYADEGMVLYVVGAGTEEGSLLTEPESGQPMLDENNQPVTTRLNPALLQELAAVTGGTFLMLDDVNSAVETTANTLFNLSKIAVPNPSLVNYYSFSPWILLIVFLLLTMEVWKNAILSFTLNRKLQKAFLVAVICLGGVSVLQAQNVKKFLNEGTEAYKNGDWKIALAAFDKVLMEEPGNVQAKFYRGLALFKDGNLEKAAADFGEMAASGVDAEKQAAGYNNAGIAYAQNNKLAEAISALKQALKANPSDAEIRQNLQKALMEQKKQNPLDDKDGKKPPPPMKEDDANKKLQSLMDEEKRTREKMKPKPGTGGEGKRW